MAKEESDPFHHRSSQTAVIQCLPRLVDDMLIVQAPYKEGVAQVKETPRRPQKPWMQRSHTLTGLKTRSSLVFLNLKEQKIQKEIEGANCVIRVEFTDDYNY